MKRIFPFILPLIVAALNLIYLHAFANEARLLRVSDRAHITLSEAMDDSKRAQLIFVGENHVENSHHRAQLAVIRVLHGTGVSLVLGLEMFRRQSQEGLDRWIAGELSRREFQSIYYDNWNYPWTLYRDIFLYARKHKIPIIGLNVPRDITRQVARQGFASLTPEQIGELPEVACNVDQTYMEFIRRSFGAHAHGHTNFTYFCEAQIVWDTAMAWTLLTYLKKNPEATAVVLAGGGHAWKRGIPEQVRRRSDVPYRVILPEEQGRLDRDTVSPEDADYLWLSM